jgi:hypothetical protein
MADLKISELAALAGGNLAAGDLLAIADNSASETKSITVTDLVGNATTLIADATIPGAKILFSAGDVSTSALADGSVTTAKLADDAVTAAKIADESTVDLVTTLPASGAFIGQIALDTTDNTGHIWDGGSWVSFKAAGSVNAVVGDTSGIVNLSVSTVGDQVTITTTLDNTTAARQFLAGPTGAGGTVGYRQIVSGDIPTASTSKGGVAVNGNGLTMSGDTIQIDNTVVAETTEHHLVQYDANGLVTGGRVINAGDIPVATSTTVGTVKPGSGLGVDGTGDLSHSNSVVAGTATKFTFDTEGHVTATESLLDTDIPDLDAAKITTGEFPTARIANAAVTAEKLADRSTATIAELTPTSGAFIGQAHLNSITGDYFLWDGNVWQPIGISVGEIVLAGTYDASTNLIDTVTSEGTALGFTVGQGLPAPSNANSGYYVIVSIAGNGSPPAPTVQLNPPDFLLSNGTVWTEIDVSDTVVAQQAQNVAFTPAGDIQSTNVQGAIEELDTEKAPIASPVFTGNVTLDTAGTLIFEGATDNEFETTLTVADPTADRTLTLPDVSGNIVTTGDTGTVSSTMIVNGTIVDADVSATADIAVDKLAPGTARQLLQTNVAGNGVQFTSNVDVPGTLDVTGATTLDSSLTVTGLISADGKISFPAGTAALPSIYFSTDTNTGLYQSAADEVSISTAGTQRVVVDAQGDVGIGISNPGQKFVVADSVSPRIRSQDSSGTNQYSDFFQLNGATFIDSRNDTSNGVITFRGTGGGVASEYMRIDSAGNVGIGTSNPTSLLHLASNAPYIDFEDIDNNQDWRVQATAWFAIRDETANAERMRIDSAGNVGIGTSSPGAKLEVSEASPTDGILATFRNSTNLVSERAGIRFEQSNTSQLRCDLLATRMGSNAGVDFSIELANSAGGNQERFRITEAGNVGIGTSSPDAPLHIEATVPELRFTDSDDTNNPVCSIIANEGNLAYRPDNGATGTGGTHVFYGSGDSERMRIDSSGNVGIGTSAPLEKLHIAEGTPVLLLEDTGGTTAGVEASALVRVNDTLTFQTRDSANAFVSNDYLQYLGASGVSTHAWRIDNTEAMRIDSAGNVGIGTNSPGSAKLNVLGNTTLQGDLAISATSTGGEGGQITLKNADKVTTGGILDISTDHKMRLFQTADNSVLQIGQLAGTGGIVTLSTAAAERMRIDSAGNVGIGQTSPAATLDVNGAYASNITAVAALDLDLSTANYFTKTIAANSTFTFSSPAASRAVSFTLELTHTSGTVTWPTSVKWPGDVAPTLTTGKTHLFMFVTDDGGTTYRGASLVDYTN